MVTLSGFALLSSSETNVIKSGAYKQGIINRDRLSTWLIVGKLGQDMRCCKCISNSNVLVCETQGKVCICMGASVSQ